MGRRTVLNLTQSFVLDASWLYLQHIYADPGRLLWDVKVAVVALPAIVASVTETYVHERLDGTSAFVDSHADPFLAFKKQRFEQIDTVLLRPWWPGL
jgi:hypothetical protein